VNFRTLDLGPISPETAVMPLAENIERYIKASGGKALIRDVLRNVKIGKLHPKKSDVFNAGMLSKLFEIDGDYVKSRQ
jgi:hypothetical protein